MEHSLEDVIRQADELYSKRRQMENVHASLDVLLPAALEISEFAVDWRVGRAYFFLGQEETKPETAHFYHSQGITMSRRAAENEAQRVEGHFWLGVNLALAGALRRSLGAIQMALEAKSELKRAIEIDETYHDAGPLRVLARLEHKLPLWLGKKTDARFHYERAIAIAPNNTVSRIYFAELLLDMNDKESARGQLETVMNMSGDPNWEFETERDKARASEMLVTLK